MSCCYRFLPCYRLKKSTQYQVVFKKANKFVSRYFVVFLKCNRQSVARLGIVVTKKCSKKAVIRNQLKRIIRESFRHHYFLIKGYDVVVIARKSIIWLDKITVRHFLDRQWAKLSVRLAT